MGIQFILGRAGTGKTKYCLDQLRAEADRSPDGPALLLLVPDQATFQLEQALVAATGAASRVGIYSFRRLAWRILDETGGLTGPAIGPVGRLMLIRRILSEERSRLRLFSGRAGPATADRIGRLLDECRVAGLDPIALGDLSRQLDEQAEDLTLAARIHDLALIGAELDRRLEGRYTDPEALLSVAAEQAGRCSFLRGSTILIDGFAGFTGVEYKLLSALMELAGSVRIALCLDPEVADGQPRPGSLFYPLHRTYHRLWQLAANAGLDLAAPVVLSRTRRFTAPALDYIERHALDTIAQPYRGDKAPVTLLSAADVPVEVEAAARHILSLVRDRGWRWRDIGVLVRDMDRYGPVIGGVFRQLGIPLYIDRRRPVGHHPLVELVRTTVECAVDGRAGPVIRWLRTGFAGLDRDLIDRLDNEVLARGYDRNQLLGGITDDNLSLSPAELETIAGCLEPLRAASTRLQGRIIDQLRALVAMMDQLGVREQLAGHQSAAEAAGDLDLAALHRQVWDGVTDLLEQLALVSDEEITPGELLPVLETGFAALRMGMIPPGLDQVLVGTVDRSRQPPLRSVLVLGFNEGSYYARQAAGDGFTDEERETIDRLVQLEVGQSARERALAEPFLTYVALTRASEDLYVSYVTAAGGRAELPSPIAHRLQSRMGLPLVIAGPGGGDGIKSIIDEKLAVRDLLPRLREDRVTGIWSDVYQWVVSQGDHWERALASTSESGRSESLPREVVAELLGETPVVSVTAVERYAACPFSFLAGYLLRLRPRQRLEYTALQRGLAVHDGLAELLPQVALLVDRDECTDQRIEELVDGFLSEFAGTMGGRVLSSEAWPELAWGGVRRLLCHGLSGLAEHLRRSGLRPALIEWEFGPGSRPLVVAAGDRELVVRGRVDRVDSGQLDGQTPVAAIEYKTGIDRFSVERVVAGLSLQLPLYLDRALAELGPDAVPAAMLSYRIHDRPRRFDLPPDEHDVERERIRSLRPSGLVVNDPAVVRLMDRTVETYSDTLPVRLLKSGGVSRGGSVSSTDGFELLMAVSRLRLAELGTAMVAGEFPVRPARYRTLIACGRCDYGPVCGRDRLLPGHRARRMDLDGDPWVQAKTLVGDDDE